MTTTTLSIEDLPDNILLDHVVAYLSTAERCILFGANRRFFFQVKNDCERGLRELILLPNQCVKRSTRVQNRRLLNLPPSRLMENLSYNLHTLDISSYATDRFLEHVTNQGIFPMLKIIRMVGSTRLTDVGLEWLSRHPTMQLKVIDITFCRKTSYAGTFCLRDRFGATLQTIRRQPAWLDGHFHTPFTGSEDTEGGDNEKPEVHTYYPDGTFSFTRSNQSRGFVADLKEDWESGDDDEFLTPSLTKPWQLDCLVDKLQYSNFTPYPGWPSFTEFSYRPGVCLFPLPDEVVDDGSTLRSILVGQNLYSLKPTMSIQGIVEAHIGELSGMAVGTSVYYGIRDPTEGFVRVPDTERSPTVLISRMRVTPLNPWEQMPPPSLEMECRRACQAIRDIGTDVIDRFEEDLVRILSR